MHSVSVLWVDGDAQQSETAMRLLRFKHPDWHVVAVASPDLAAMATASQDWEVVVFCIGAQAQDVPAMLEMHAGKCVLMCVYPHQEGLAARAFRCGLGDYVVRNEDGATHLDELVQRLEALHDRAVHGTSVGGLDARMSRRTLALLQEQRLALQATLASMSQGIFKVAPDGRVTVYNQRVLELLDLPESVMAARPNLTELARLQLERGDFQEGKSKGDGNFELFLANGNWSEAVPEVYWRTTRHGRDLEIRTTVLPDGGLVRTFADVTDYVRVEKELRESEERFRSLNDLSSDWYWEHDAQGRFVQLAGDLSVNGLSNSQVLGRTRWEIGALNMTECNWVEHRAVLASKKPFRDLELQRQRPDGSMHWISVSGVPILNAVGELRGYRGVGRDITERKQVALQIERLAFYDMLTGLPNRRLLIDRLERAIALSARTGAHGALLFIDLDNFKDLNDTQGHDQGDLLLVEVAKRLKSCVRSTDTVARFGGDEFVVLVEGLNTELPMASAEAALVGSHIVTALGKPYLLGSAAHHSTPSIGIALFDRKACKVDDLLKQADLAMYQAKAAGRNTQRFFDPQMQAAVSARSELEVDLRRGLQAGELLLHFQPVVDGKGRFQGAEALVRWSHPQRGLVPPAQFIGLAEQTGLILPLGQQVIEMACIQLVGWARFAHTRDLVLSVNVSVRQFRQSDFAEQVLGALRSSGANPERLKLELTESLLMADVEEVIARMDYLRGFGVRFSLDDFGTGYSSLSYLKRLPLDQLKIDRSFVRDLQTDPNDAAIVRTILALAHSLDLAVVAEGVETTGQYDFLKRHGCQLFQGYLFGRPMPSDAMDRALRPAL